MGNNITYEVEDDDFVALGFSGIEMEIAEPGDRAGFFLRNVFWNTSARNRPMPKIRKKPNLSILRNTDLYREVKAMCGLPATNRLPSTKWSLERGIALREMGLRGRPVGGFSPNEQRRIASLFIPNKKERKLMSLESKVHICKMNKDGSRLVTCSHDQLLRVFDSSKGTYHRINRMQANCINLCTIDLDFSPCGQFLAYSTWSDSYFILPINGSSEDLKSINLNVNENRFGVLSLRFSPDGKSLIGGCSNARIYICDRETSFVTSVKADSPTFVHINAISYVNDQDSNVFLTGSNQGVLKLWDTRCLSNSAEDASVGTFYGHLDGVTYIDARNDGRYMLSNSKDQSIKLWDLRKTTDRTKVSTFRRLPSHCWDYRWDTVPREFYNCKPCDGDVSLMSYRGHRVTRSLLRAKFSPLLQTGQRFIYTGCGTGRIIIYDLLTGNIREAIEGHKDIVRDLSWHPVRSEIVSGSWDSHVNLNTFKRTSMLKTKNSDLFTNVRRSRRIAQKKGEVVDMMEDEPSEDW